MSLTALLEDHYGIKANKINPLQGYSTSVYHIRTGNSSYILKKYRIKDDEAAFIQSETAVMLALQILKEYNFPCPIAHKEKGFETVIRPHIYRLLTFVEGHFFAEVKHTKELLFSFGKCLGEMDRHLLSIKDQTIKGKVSRWDIKYFKINYTYLTYIDNAKDRSLVDYFFMQFDEHVGPIQHEFRQSIIHGDANDWNVLTDKGEVSGIIDFGDMAYSWLINDLAIGLAYAMMQKEDPIENACHVIKGYSNVLSLTELEIGALYYLIAARLCITVCNAAYTKTIHAESEYVLISEAPAWDLIKKWIAINPIAAKERFASAAGLTIPKILGVAQQIKRRKKILSDSFSLSYENPIGMNQAAFQYMYDTVGNSFLDAYNNIMLAGHCHPTVVRAGQRAMAKLNTNTRYVYEELLSYSEHLLSKFPKDLNKIFFVNSGSAATDLALRLALHYTKNNNVMVLEHGYHGNTKSGIELSHYKYNRKEGVGKAKYILEAAMPKAFGSGFKDNSSAGNHFALQAISRIQDKIAAFIAEPVMGCGGQVPLAKNYLKRIYPEIRSRGGVCISDEVQVGFGRLGDFFWGFEMHDVIPDMVILGKPMGNGHPIGAVVTTTKIAESFGKGPEFFSSFGGNPVSCAIGEAVLKTIEVEKLQEHAKLVGDYLKRLLRALQKENPVIADVRGSGLFLGVELQDARGYPNPVLAENIKNGLRERFILIGTDGSYNNVLKIKPPLSFTKKDAERLVETMRMIFNLI